MCGFMTDHPPTTITLPNFRQWSPDSEFVRYKRAEQGAGGAATHQTPPGRLWRYMVGQCVRGPCHEVVHLFQSAVGQKMTSQAAEHDAYFAMSLLLAASRERCRSRADAN